MKIVLTKKAKKQYEMIKQEGKHNKKCKGILEILADDPFKYPPYFEKLSGYPQDTYSRRINKQHRVVYYIVDETVVIVSMRTHYEF